MADRLFSPGTQVSSTNKTDCHDKTEILLKVALHTVIQNQTPISILFKVQLYTGVCFI
jgi:hypothetical protein